MLSLDHQLRKAKDMILDTNPQKTTIVSHADHDGLTADVVIDTLALQTRGKTIQKLHPSPAQPYTAILSKIKQAKPKLLLIVDALLSKHKNSLEKIAESGTTIINLDHHDDFTLKTNYIDLNPHRWGIEYLNSSGLTWLLARQYDETYYRERAWAPAAGAAQDYCIEDNQELFQTTLKQGIIKDTNLWTIIDSPLMEIAKMINSSVEEIGAIKTYKILLEAYKDNEPRRLTEHPEIKKAYTNYLYEKDVLLKTKRPAKKETIKKHTVEFYTFREKRVKYTTEIAEAKPQKNRIVIGYNGRIVLIRALDTEIDARLLARPLGGGGPHPRVAGAKTTIGEKRVWEIIEKTLQGGGQRTLIEFY